VAPNAVLVSAARANAEAIGMPTDADHRAEPRGHWLCFWGLIPGILTVLQEVTRECCGRAECKTGRIGFSIRRM
jgi:hypothetical protein